MARLFSWRKPLNYCGDWLEKDNLLKEGSQVILAVQQEKPAYKSVTVGCQLITRKANDLTTDQWSIAREKNNIELIWAVSSFHNRYNKTTSFQIDQQLFLKSLCVQAAQHDPINSLKGFKKG